VTAHAVRAGSPGVSSYPSGLVGTGFLLRFMLRRDMVRLMVPTAALLVFCVYYVTATRPPRTG
jgi:ABC-2 type transport system permease protein